MKRKQLRCERSPSAAVSRLVPRNFLAAALALAFAVPAQSDNLPQVMAHAYRHSNILEQNRYLLRLQDEDVAQAVAQLRPIITLIASMQRDPVEDTSFASASLVAEYLVYDGGARRFAVEAAQETVLATRNQLLVIEQQVLLDAVTAYLNVWGDTQIAELNERNVQVIAQQLRAASDRFDVGEGTRTDVAQAEALLATARSQLVGAQGTLQISRELFALAVGRYPDGALNLGARPTTPSTQEAAQALAGQGHPAIQALQHEVRAAELGIEQARAGLRPTVDFEGTFANTLENSADPLAEGPSTTADWTLTQPIFEGGALLSLERQSRAQAASVQASLGQQMRINIQAVGEAWASMTVAVAQITAADQGIAATDLAFEGVQQEAALGARTTLDILEAEQDGFDVRIDRIEAQTDLYLASYQLLSASGLLTVEALGLPVPEYAPAIYGNMFSNAPSAMSSPQGERLDTVLERVGR